MKPNKHTWKEYCLEDDLTPAELEAQRDMHRAMREDPELHAAITAATAVEYREKMDITKRPMSYDWNDWTDLAMWEDARRRLIRAELGAFGAIKEVAGISTYRRAKGALMDINVALDLSCDYLPIDEYRIHEAVKSAKIDVGFAINQIDAKLRVLEAQLLEKTTP